MTVLKDQQMKKFNSLRLKSVSYDVSADILLLEKPAKLCPLGYFPLISKLLTSSFLPLFYDLMMQKNNE